MRNTTSARKAAITRPVQILFSSDLSRSGDFYDDAMDTLTKARSLKRHAADYLDFIPVTPKTARRLRVGDFVISANQTADQRVSVYEPARIFDIANIGHEVYLLVAYPKDTAKRILPWKTFKKLAVFSGASKLQRFEHAELAPAVASLVIENWGNAKRLAN